MKKQTKRLLAAVIAISIFAYCTANAQGQSITERYARLLTPTEKYVANRTSTNIRIDGVLDTDEWGSANTTNLFTDISGEGHPTPRFKTTAMILWDDDYLYVGASMEEPDVWAYITERDSVIYFDNDFEIFLDPDNDGKNYFEMEFNAIANIFDLALEHAYRSPDSCFVNFAWNAPGMKVATHIYGTLNDNRDTDKGWDIEVAIPRTAVTDEFANFLQPGNILSVGFSRVEWQTDKMPDGNYSIKKDKNGDKIPEDNWTWGPTGRVAMHMPERWGKVYLSDSQTGNTFPEIPDEGLMSVLWAIFYHEEAIHESTGRYITDIRLSEKERAMAGADIRIETTTHTYEIIATKKNGEIISLNHNGTIWRHKPEPTKIKVYGWYVWEDDKVSEDSLFSLFTEWHSHGLRGVCVNNGFDYDKIARCALIAHRAGLEYHAWAPTVIHGGKDSTWYTVNRLGKSAFNPKDRAYVEYYQTLDPHNPEVIKFLTESYMRMAEIPHVDYVQLDYIRYADAILAEGLWDKYDDQIHHQWRDRKGKVHEFPGADYCYCDACCADFLQKTGIDIRKKLAKGIDPSTIKEWAQFRCDIITNLVNTICDSIHAHGYKISADVFPGPENYAEPMVRQQWRKWNVDMLFPMNYNDFYLKDAHWVEQITRQECDGMTKPIISGLFICPDWKNKDKVIDPENSGLVPSELRTAIQGAMKAGATAICLFTPDRMSAEHWKVFEKLVNIK